MEQEVADDGGLGSPWMGLLGLAGGGGGGGGGFGGGGGGGFGIGGGVIDGYVSGATVFWDINSNFIHGRQRVGLLDDHGGGRKLQSEYYLGYRPDRGHGRRCRHLHRRIGRYDGDVGSKRNRRHRGPNYAP